ncbi:MAG: hypothetical protein WCJ95_19375 [Mariniphaga sp.]
MTLKVEVISKIADLLPYGSAKMIHVRLDVKDIKLSYQYVWRCLSLKHSDENFDVTHEAALLSEEIVAKKDEQRRLISLFKNRKTNGRDGQI